MKAWVLWLGLLCAEARAAEVPADVASGKTGTVEAVADPVSGKLPGQLWTRLSEGELLRLRPRLRGGRAATWVSWGMLGAGTVLLPIAASLNTYRPPDEWYDVWKYNRSYLARSAASGPLIGVAVGLMGSSVIVQTAGVMVEARALGRITGRKPVVGWVGTGLIAGSLAFGAGFSWTPLVAIQFAPVFLAGWGCIIGQWVINLRIAHDLPAETRDLLYAHHRRPEVVVVPMLSPRQGEAQGLAVVGRF